MLRGIPLPETGTFESKLLAEGIQRERNEKFAFAALLSQFAHLMGAPEERLKPLLSAYAEELYQFRYNSRYVAAELQLQQEKASREAEDRETLARAMALTSGRE
jgi:hypothetical protein